MNLKEELIKYQDINYKNWLNNGGTIREKELLGVRVPKLREISKNIVKDKDYNILKEDSIYFEEEMIKGFVLSYRKHKTFNDLKKDIEYWIPHITSWDLCDSFCVTLKETKKYKKETFEFLQKYITSNKEFEVRFALVMYLSYFLEDEYIDIIFENIEKIRNNDFYCEMGIAWCIATAFAKQEEKTFEWFKTCNLNVWTYNKTIQKSIESFRVNNDLKEKLKKMKK